MILHIADDEKFIDNIIELFEKVNSGNNIYLINHQGNVNQLKNIKQKDKIKVCYYKSVEYSTILKQNYSAIIFHGLLNYKLEILQAIPERIHLHWMAWGYDLYSLPILEKYLFLPSTQRFLNKKKRKIEIVYAKIAYGLPGIWNLLNLIRYNKSSNYYQFKKAVKRFNSVSTIVDTEYKLIQKYLKPDIKFYPFRYGSINQLGKGILDDICNENNILVGNSATYTNNHLDAFDFLKNFNGFEKIYAPLSYGDSNYALFIAKEGKRIFGNAFIPLLEFLSLEDYNKILKKCGKVIMNHTRQQGMGNIIISLWLGARIYLQSANPIYQFLKENDFKIYDIKNFTNSVEETHEDLAYWNREKLKNFYDHKVILEMTEKLVKYLTNHN